MTVTIPEMSFEIPFWAAVAAAVLLGLLLYATAAVVVGRYVRRRTSDKEISLSAAAFWPIAVVVIVAIFMVSPVVRWLEWTVLQDDKQKPPR